MSACVGLSTFLGRKWKRKLPMHHPFLALDIENDPKTGDFICAAIAGKIQGRMGIQRVEKIFRNRNYLMNWLMALYEGGKGNMPCYLAMFNGGYDHPFIQEIIDDTTLIYCGSRFISAKLKNGIRIIDCANHVNGSLEDWIKYLDMEKKGIKKLNFSNIEERNLMDARATYELVSFLEDFYVDYCGVPIKTTVGATALQIFERNFFHSFWIRKKGEEWVNEYERKSYRGARTEVFKRGSQKVKSYDVNSMYLSIMHEELFPDPSSWQFIEAPGKLKKGWRFYYENFMGIFRVKVKVPDQKIPPLPYPDPKTGKLLFPIGILEGYWTSIELKEAEKYGVEILEVYDFVYYKKSSRFFENYAEFIWNLRKHFKKMKNKGMEKVIKTLGNSLYGKFGEQNSVLNFYGKWEDFNSEKLDLPEDFTLEGKRLNYTTINGVEYVSISIPDKEDSKHTFACLPSFTTAYGRIKLLRQLKAHEDTAVYCDTDSIHILEVDSIESGEELGEWGFEYQREQTYYRPKLYISKEQRKHKGIPQRAEIEITATEIIGTFEKPYKYREAIVRGKIPSQWHTQVKRLSLQDDKREWNGNESRPKAL